MSETADGRVRVDKWLWAARFFKTRALACAAVDGGAVRLNGERVKPAHALKAGDELRVRRGEQEFTVTVLALDTRRGPASQAQLLYAETAASQAARQAAAEARSLAPEPEHRGRPTKRDRRRIIRFTEG